MSSLHLAVLVSFAICFLSFIWAMYGGFFQVVNKIPLGVSIIQAIGLMFLIVHTVALLQPGRVRGAMGAIGFGIYCLSFVLFWSAIRANWQTPLSHAFSIDQPEHLTQHGPYRYIRHPVYTSYCLAWLAGAIASAQTGLLPSVLVMGALYYAAAVKEERKFSGSALAKQYRAYRARTGMFVPHLLPGRGWQGQAAQEDSSEISVL